MPDDPQADITTLLEDIRAGKPSARDRFARRVEGELREIAARFLRRERADHLLQPTAVVNEAWLKLFPDRTSADFSNRVHFLASAAQAMRQVLVSYARDRDALKRGGDRRQEPWDSQIVIGKGRRVPVEKIDEGLINLALVNERQAKIVELSFFGGLTHAEIAEYLGVSLATVERDWRFARAWLKDHLEGVA